MRLWALLAALYAVEQVCAPAGPMNQLIRHYLVDVERWTSTQVSAFFAISVAPWYFKLGFGAVYDRVRSVRKLRYAILVAALATISALFVAMSACTGILALCILLTVASALLAAINAICGAMVVIEGRAGRSAYSLINVQWIAFNAAALTSLPLAGYLAGHAPAGTALAYGALCVAAVPAAGIVAVVLAAKNRVRGPDAEAAWAPDASPFRALRSTRFWFIAAFLFGYFFNPGFGSPFYVHMTHELRFSQSFVGHLNALPPLGWIAGSAVVWIVLKQGNIRRNLLLAGLLSSLSNLAFLAISDHATAIAVYALSGVANAVFFVAAFGLVAEVAPRGGEGAIYAALTSVAGIAYDLSDVFGSYLYDHVLDRNLTALILISAGSTPASLLLLPLVVPRNVAAG